MKIQNTATDFILLNDILDDDQYENSNEEGVRESKEVGERKNSEDGYNDKESSVGGLSTVFEIVDKTEIELVRGRKCERL